MVREAETGAPESETRPRLSAEVLADKRRCFEIFRKSYAHNDAVEENKALLRSRYDEAKATGKLVNSARSSINALKSKIEEIRRE